MNEKEYTEGIEVQSRSLKKLDNFWYHYKWHVLFTLFFVIVFVICTVQMCTQKADDMLVLYSGSESLDGTERENIESVFKYLTYEEGYSVGITAYNVLSEDEIKALEAETDDDGKPVFVDRSFFVTEYDMYSKYLMTGESSVMLLSPWLYEGLASTDRLREISSVADNLDEDALVGEYGIELGKTDIYAKYEALQILPEDTVICFARANYGVGKNSRKKHYAKEEELFRAIVEFESTDASEE